MNYPRIARLIGRYTAEIAIIFIGITISFLFDQWRSERAGLKAQEEFLESLITDLKAKKDELTYDNPQAKLWIQRLDSIQKFRSSGKVSEKQLIWFHSIMLRGGTFFFNSSTPTFTGAIGTPVWQSLADSTKRHIYHVYMEDLEWNHLAYRQLSETMNLFRNSEMTANGILSLNLSEESSQQDLDAFAREIARPPYGGVIQNIIAGEKFLLEKGQDSAADIEKLIEEISRAIQSEEN